MGAQRPQHLGRDAEPPGREAHHGLEHAQRLGQPLVPRIRRRQIVEGQLARPPERPVPPRQPRLAPGDGRDRRRDPLLADVRERREHRLLHDAGHQVTVRDEQHVPGIFRTGVGRVPQCEVKTVDLRGRVEAVETTLVPAELDRDQHVAELVRRPRPDLDRLPHPHRSELGQPGPVAVGREPDARVPVEVGFELLAPLVEIRRRHQPHGPVGGVLPDQEGGLPHPLQQLLSPSGRRLVQRSHDALDVGRVPGRVQLRHLEPVVSGEHDLEDLGHHVRLGQVQRLEELTGRRGVRDRAPYRGQAAGHWPRQVHDQPALAVGRHDLATVVEPDDRRGPCRFPLRRVVVEEGVEARDPLIRLRLEELPGHPRYHLGRRHLVDADLVPQVAPQHRGEVLGDGRIGEPDRAARTAQGA